MEQADEDVEIYWQNILFNLYFNVSVSSACRMVDRAHSGST